MLIKLHPLCDEMAKTKREQWNWSCSIDQFSRRPVFLFVAVGEVAAFAHGADSGQMRQAIRWEPWCWWGWSWLIWWIMLTEWTAERWGRLLWETYICESYVGHSPTRLPNWLESWGTWPSGKNSPFFRFLASKLGLGQALPLEVEVTVDPGTGISSPDHIHHRVQHQIHQKQFPKILCRSQFTTPPLASRLQTSWSYEQSHPLILLNVWEKSEKCI